jgi:beta-glucosidase
MTPDHAALIKSLDLPAKVKLLTGATAFTLAPDESIGLGELRLSDGPTGVRGLKFSGGRVVALFPNATLLASAWSEDTAYEVGRLLAEEALAQQIHVVLGPTINLHRTPLGGRLFEAYSEDPLLTGKLAARVRARHAGRRRRRLPQAPGGQRVETDRNTVDSVVDEATLREVYLLPFEIASPTRRVVDDGRLQRRQRAGRRPSTGTSTRDRQGRVGLPRADHVGLVRHPDRRARRQRRSRPGDARPARAVGRRAGRGRPRRRGRRGGDRRPPGRLLLLAERVGALGTPREYPTICRPRTARSAGSS